jgi:dolichol-phosphate mannosyltransferase
MPVVSIVLPIYNEQENIRLLVNEIGKELDSFLSDYEIIMVDDGSTDESLVLIRELASNDPRIKYMSFSRNFGQQAALTAGLDYSNGEAVITMDADLQDPPELLSQMIKAWKEGYEIVYMRRRKRHDSWFKRRSAQLYYNLLKNFSDNQFTSNVGEFRLVDRKVVRELSKLKEKTRYLRGMMFWMGYSHVFIDYDRPNRQRGESGFTLARMIRLGMNGILNFSLFPLRLGLILGMLVIPTGFFFLIYFIADISINNVVYPLYKWLSVITFIFTGFLFILIWILGEYIGKIYNEVKDRPIYLIKEKGNIA